MSKQDQAYLAISSRYPMAHDVVWHGDNNYSAKMLRCMAYFVMIDGKIVGDIWFE